MRTAALGAGLALLVGCSCREVTDSGGNVDVVDVDRIDVHYTHFGWDQIEESFTVTPASTGGDFMLQARYESTTRIRRNDRCALPKAAVARLVNAAQMRPWSRQQGIEVLAGELHRSELFPRVPPLGPDGTCTFEELRVLARERLRATSMPEVVDTYFGNGMGWTDDYPHAEVRIVRRDGSVRHWSSSSQRAMLLPWTPGQDSAGDPEGTQNWAVPISQALVDIIPEDACLHVRLNGVDAMRRYLQMATDIRARRDCRELRPGADRG